MMTPHQAVTKITNGIRAIRGEAAVAAYVRHYTGNVSDPQAPQDAITDILHAHEARLVKAGEASDPDTVILAARSAIANYLAERLDPPDGMGIYVNVSLDYTTESTG